MRRKPTPAYVSWKNMQTRCRYRSHPSYKNYGGRGITICDRWMRFENFLADMGERPAGMQLDRIDNNGNYEPGNCRWVTQHDNLRNRRNCHYVMVAERQMTLGEAIRALGLNESTVRARVRRGADPQQALR